MVTIRDYHGYCAHWSGDSEAFSWLVNYADIIGMSQRDIATEFECAPSTVSRWAKGEAVPHKRIQKLVVVLLQRKAQQLEGAAIHAVPLQRLAVG